MEESLKFKLVLNPVVELVPIVTSRLPKSIFIFNILKLYPSFKNEHSFYIFGNIEDESSCWVLNKFKREDDKQLFAISAPTGIYTVPAQVRKAFESIPSELINWNDSFEFAGIDPFLNDMIASVSINHGNATLLMPCTVFYFDRTLLSTNMPYPNISSTIGSFTIKSCDTEAGEKFFKEEFPYLAKKFNRKRLSSCPSIGAYLDENMLVSNATLSPTGHIGLTTSKQYRKLGLAAQSYKILVNSILEDTQLVPMSCVYDRNKESIALHHKLIRECADPASIRTISLTFIHYQC